MATITSTPVGGDWNQTTTWLGGVVPTPSDDVVIRADSTVTIDSSRMGHNSAGVHVQLGTATTNGSLTVSGTLEIAINATPTTMQDLIGIAIYMGSTLLVDTQGTLNINSAGNVGNVSARVYTIMASQNGSVTNQGLIRSTTRNVNGGLAYGLVLDDPGTTFTNTGTIEILESGIATDGNGHCYGIWVRNGDFENEKSGKITSQFNSYGTVQISAGSFTNQGVFENEGHILNNAAFTNSGTLQQVLPVGQYSGGAVSGDGIVELSGSLVGQTSLSQVMPGQTNFLVPSGSTLNVSGSLEVPEGANFGFNGDVLGAGSVDNNGDIVIDLSEWNSHSSSIQNFISRISSGSGSLSILGTLPENQRVSFNTYKSALEVNGTVVIPAGSTLDISGPSFKVNTTGEIITEGISESDRPAGIFTFDQTITNLGQITNNGILRYQISSWSNRSYEGITGNIPTGSGIHAITGYLPKAFTLADLYSDNAYILAGDRIQANFDLTVPSNFTLTIAMGASLDPLGDFTIEGTLNNAGTLKAIKRLSALKLSGHFTNTGVVEYPECGAKIVHVLPSAQFSGSSPEANTNTDNPYIVPVSLQGTQSAPVDISDLGYGNGFTYTVSSETSLNVSNTLTVARNYSFIASGNLTVDKLQNNGTFAYDFDTCDLKMSDYGAGGVTQIYGTLRSQTYASGENADVTFAKVIAKFPSVKEFVIPSNESLDVFISTTLPDDIQLVCNGRLSLYYPFTLPGLAADPANGTHPYAQLTIKPGGYLDISSTLNIQNTARVGIWLHGLNQVISTGDRAVINANAAIPVTSNSDCTILVERTCLNNYGTIIAGQAADPQANPPQAATTTIACVQGMVCGGSYTGADPIGSGLEADPTVTYAATCTQCDAAFPPTIGQ